MNEQKQNEVMSDKGRVLPFKAIIFDMDGTLLESTEADYRAWEKIFNDYGKKLSYEDYVPLLGIRSADVIKNYVGKPNPDDVKRILKEKFDYFVEYVNANPVKAVEGAEDFLKSLAKFNVKVGLATSSRKEKMKMVLERLDFLQYFDSIVTGEEVENRKPAPDIFLKAAERLGVSADQCLVVEDGPVGVAAAKNAKMKCVAITATHPAQKLDHADLIIDTYKGANFEELSQKLQPEAVGVA